MQFCDAMQFIDSKLFFDPYGGHGPAHVYRVMFLADKLAQHEHLSEEDHNTLMCACCYHDIGRINNNTDFEHGQLSAEKCDRLKLFDNFHLTNTQIDQAKLLMIYHAKPDGEFITNKQTLSAMYKIIKDADGLDRVRFGDLNPVYLRLPYSHQLIDTAYELLDETEPPFAFLPR